MPRKQKEAYGIRKTEKPYGAGLRLQRTGSLLGILRRYNKTDSHSLGRLNLESTVLP